jgi:NAD(P)-dependent dehydrogenase (short-subunit alcohol dehydrogenase family)
MPWRECRKVDERLPRCGSSSGEIDELARPARPEFLQRDHLGRTARAVKGSVSDEADLNRLYAAVKAERGTLDIVFANAGLKRGRGGETTPSRA